MKIKGYIPNLFTFLNLSLGILAILHIIKNNYYISALLILLAALLDRYDGKIARKFNATSSIGKELDSLCDLISFGVAPSILIWHSQLIDIGVLGIAITILFAIAGAYRLARYNIIEFDGVYVGVPITLSGGILAITSLYTIKYQINVYILIFIMLTLSYAMVSNKIKLKKR
ncbi:CDP-diacylglycerol--serine O-phosphatidyltransferase [Caloranaerobacter azorensis DSM 13643]|uniref:CDP-diacylglycerol--serine O-phosphatidyltransferase n=1 Tax=Caloranaerobacter azorensis DSM 13643 TaxID=1121264 RepID=A0A1M5USD9_9FIRM|nr:CDP-diacylglycerol--serine O-phosphatidyltransferase [Caloranaerobacter azorensis]SHH65830.1 CDP-diacylglycerol--serine O-phosphatidyltransferase [Caloranaerobacter azorensis DSM 13643]